MIQAPETALAKPLEKSMKLPAIDVLRGVAALGVAWYHSRVDLWVGFKPIQADPEAYSVFDWGLSFLSLPISHNGQHGDVVFRAEWILHPFTHRQQKDTTELEGLRRKAPAAHLSSLSGCSVFWFSGSTNLFQASG